MKIRALFLATTWLVHASVSPAKTEAKKEIMLIKHWQAGSKKGSQPFVIESEHEQTSGVLSWDLTTNTWQFEYPHVKYEIKDNKLIKKDGDQLTTYPCIGFSAFLQHPIETWQTILEKKHEVCNENVCFLFVTYNKKPMIWKYRTNPFALLSIALEDSSGRYYQMDFEVDVIEK